MLSTQHCQVWGWILLNSPPNIDDEFIQSAIDDGESFILSHIKEPYDPKKRREYYLKTRKLKGRKKGSSSEGEAPKGNLEARRAASKKRRETQKAQIARLERKLEHLNDVLSNLVAAAKKRSGVEEVNTKSKAKAQTPPARKTTQKEKREAAERAAKTRKKENPTSQNQEVAQLQQKIAEVQKKIAAAIEKARQEKQKASKSKKVTATKGR